MELCCNHDSLTVGFFDPGNELVETAFVVLIEAHTFDFYVVAEKFLLLLYLFLRKVYPNIRLFGKEGVSVIKW